MVNMTDTSPAWPYIKAIANCLTIPGTKIGLQSLTELQDDLSDEKFQNELITGLDAIRDNTERIVALLKADKLNVTQEDLNNAAQEIAEKLYLHQVAADFMYADFKGIEQVERFVPLKLDDIFVNLKAQREQTLSKAEPDQDRLREELQEAKGQRRNELEQRLEEMDTGRFKHREGQNPQHGIDEILKDPTGIVMLGGPGSGKTTLVKRLARLCALGPEELKQHYPELPWCFPVVIPITLYDDYRANQDLGIYTYIEQTLVTLGGKALLAAFYERWSAGQCLLLLDGLDEVADTGRRIGAARDVDELLPTIGDNRVLITSRIVGYRICQLKVPADHYNLHSFERDDVEAFIRKWYWAYEQSVHPEEPNQQMAQHNAESLILEISTNKRIESLATNPLMLTIVALIKHRNVVLPQRRVELYEVALNTLVRSWNKARSLAGKQVGRVNMDEIERLAPTKSVWREVAHWMHGHTSRGTVHGTQLHEQLVQVLKDADLNDIEAEAAADSYIETASESSGLLEARGQNFFAFIHQTFQEYLAALHLAIPSSEAEEKVLEVSRDPHWHEVIRLSVGYIGVVTEDVKTATTIIEALLNDEDPLEPYICESLRLAASCIADDVRIRPQVTDKVIMQICSYIESSRHMGLQQKLTETLCSLSVTPGPQAVEALRKLTTHSYWQIRMEAIRMLSRASVSNSVAQQTLLRLYQEDNDPDVKAHAAWGLWQASPQENDDLLKPVLFQLGNSFLKLQLNEEQRLKESLLRILQDEGSNVRSHAAKVLVSWGYQSLVLPILRHLLEDEKSDVRSHAAQVLGKLGYQSETLPLLRYLLDDEKPDVRLEATRVLGDWGHRSEALPTLQRLLKDENSSVRLQATQLLSQWGHQSDALPALLLLLEDANLSVRLQATHVLWDWPPQADALPALLRLLEDENSEVRYSAARVVGFWNTHSTALEPLRRLLKNKKPDVRLEATRVLGDWDHRSEALPTLQRLLEDENSIVRLEATKILARWDRQPEALPTLLRLLEDQDSSIRAQATAVLGNWGYAEDVAEVVLKYLGLADCEPVVALLHSGRLGDTEDWSSHAHKQLMGVLKSKPDDSDLMRNLRDIVRQWVWSNSQSGV